MAKINKPTLVKPIVGGSKDMWGDILNSNIDNTEKFYTQLVSDLETKDAELARLERDKASKSDLPDLVHPIVDNYVESSVKPTINDYIDSTAQPVINSHVETKKQELNSYVDTTNKPELDKYTKSKEGELDIHTGEKKSELDTYEKAKEGQLDSHTNTKKEELNQYTVQKQDQLGEYTVAKKGELDSHTIEKKNELNTHEKAKEKELDNYVTTVNKPELDKYTNIKKEELNSHTITKESEITQVTETKKQEITGHSASELDKFNQGAKQEADKQIGRVVAEGDVQVQRVKDESTSVIPRIEALESGKVSKSGDTITGALKIDAWNNNLKLLSRGINKGEVIAVDDSVALWNATSRNGVRLYDDGTLLAPAGNLTTSTKEVVGAINEQISYLGQTYKSFPLTSATQNELYYHAGSNKMYICTSSYSGGPLSNPNGNFEEISVYTNRQRLDNLLKVELREFNNSEQNKWINVDYPIGYSNVIIMACYYTNESSHAVFTLNNNKSKFSFKQLDADIVYGSTAAYFYFFR